MLVCGDERGESRDKPLFIDASPSMVSYQLVRTLLRPQTSISSCIRSRRERNVFCPLLSASGMPISARSSTRIFRAWPMCAVMASTHSLWPRRLASLQASASRPLQPSEGREFPASKYKTGHLAWCTLKSLGLCLEQLPPSLQLSSPSILTSMEGSVFTQPRGVPDHREVAILNYSSQRGDGDGGLATPLPRGKLFQNDAPSCNQTQASLCRRVDCHGPSVMRNFTIGVVCVHCPGVSSKSGLSSSPVILIWSSTPAQWMWGGETYGSDSATRGIPTEFKHIPGSGSASIGGPTRAHPPQPPQPSPGRGLLCLT